MAFQLPKLPYSTDALEPAIDRRTMEIHHGKHHATYVKKLNDALDGHPELAGMSIEELLRNVEKVPEESRQAVIDNGGGHANHSLFWGIMGPAKGGGPEGPLADAIEAELGGLESFREKFSRAAATRFGSGWAWLAVNGDGELQVLSTPNQNSPHMRGLSPILGIDVWEHAYYLQYQNRRPDYVEAWWDVVDWEKVAERYAAVRSGEVVRAG